MSRITRTFCRNCPSACGTIAETDDDRIVAVRGDRDHPVSQGYFCVKGQMAAELNDGREPRLFDCQSRTGSGGHRPIAAADTMDEIAARLSAIMAAHGPGAVALFWGTGAYGRSFALPMAKSFMHAIGSPKLFSTMTIDQSAHWVTDMRMGIFATGKPHMEDCDTVMMWGNNPVVSHATRPWNGITNTNIAANIRKARAAGTKFIVVDPRHTETARLADLALQIRPGEDVALAAAMIRIILDEGWGNPGFRARYAANVARLRQAVDPFTPDAAARRTGLPAGQIEAAARLMGTARKAVTGAGTGVSMSGRGNLAFHLIAALNAVCGGYVTAGETIRNPGVLSKAPTEEGVIRPPRSWEQEPRLKTSGHGRIYDEFPTSQLPAEILQDGPDKIRALIVLGGNPLMALGEPDKARSAFAGLDLLVVIDPRMTETARLADYVIAPPSQFEIADLTTFRDRLYPVPFVQYTDAVVAPPPGTLGEWQFFNGVANRLGHTLTLKLGVFGRAFEHIPGGLPLDQDADWTDERLLQWVCEEAGLSLDALKRSGGAIAPDVPCPIVRAPAQDDGARLDLCPEDVAGELEAYAESRGEAGFPYLLTSRRLVETMNSMFRHGAATKRRYPRDWLYMHPEDMDREGLAAGARVHISSRFGSTTAHLRADATMRHGVVSMTHCWGQLEGDDGAAGTAAGHSSRLVSLSEDLQPQDAMPRQSAIPVRIVRRELQADG